VTALAVEKTYNEIKAGNVYIYFQSPPFLL